MEKKRIGDLLTEEGIISNQAISLALKEQQATRERVGDILLRLGLVTQTELGQAIAQQYGIEFLDLKHFTPSREALEHLSFQFAKDNSILPVAADNGTLVIATTEPDNTKVLDLAGRISKKKVRYVVASLSQIQTHIEKDYYLLQHPLEEGLREMLERSRRNAAETDAERLGRLLLMAAITSRATDIHVTPTPKTTQIHFRIDGVLYPSYAFPVEIHSRLISSIKVKAGMDISETRKPQDGRMTFDFLQESYDMRVSTLRTSQGENLVLRILSSSEDLYNFRNLGLEEDDAQHLQELLQKPFGLFLVSGPTGSGKTTTLYAALREINSMEKNIVTVEDPIEYSFPLIRQTQVNQKAEYEFASAVRAFLRQDPDVILIGEIRDPETASMAIRAATTGHLVLSTVHANDAVGAVPRLKDLGIKDYMISSSLVCVVAQRLVRALCPHCARPYAAGESEHQVFNIAPGSTLFKHTGCERCLNTGFLGRTVISEIMIVTEALERLISTGAHPFEIKEQAVCDGMYTLSQDARRKILAGRTSFCEARRVLR